MGFLSGAIGRIGKAVLTGGISEFDNLAGTNFSEAIPFIGDAISRSKDRSIQEALSAENFKRQDREFSEQAYLNRNQTQIQASDALKAGINPLAVSMGGLSSASYSNVQQSPLGSSGATEAALNIMSLLTNKSIAEKQIASNEKIAKDKNDTDRLIQEMKDSAEGKRQSERLLQEDKHFEANLEEIHSINQANISNTQAKTDLINATKDAKERLEFLASATSELDLKLKCRDFARELLSGLKSRSMVSDILQSIGINVSDSFFKGNLYEQIGVLSKDLFDSMTHGKYRNER